MFSWKNLLIHGNIFEDNCILHASKIYNGCFYFTLFDSNVTKGFLKPCFNYSFSPEIYSEIDCSSWTKRGRNKQTTTNKRWKFEKLKKFMVPWIMVQSGILEDLSSCVDLVVMPVSKNSSKVLNQFLTYYFVIENVVQKM